MPVKEVGRLKGLIPATFTPVTDDGEINLKLIPEYVKYLAGNGIEYVFINGTTGEGCSLTVEERKSLAEAWLESAAGTLKGVMVHVGAGNLREACELARHAETHGAIAISAAPTTYFKPSTVKDLLAYCKVIAASAPSLPFYYYHIPGLTGCQVPIDEFYSAAVVNSAVDFPNFRGVKFSSTDVISLGSCLQIRNQHPEHEIFWGVDEALIVAIDWGLQCGIGSTYNMMAPVGRLIMELQRRGQREAMMNWLLFLQEVVKTFKRLAKESSMIAVMKTTATLITGLQLGPVRVPLANVEDQSKLAKELESLKLVTKIQEAEHELTKLK